MKKAANTNLDENLNFGENQGMVLKSFVEEIEVPENDPFKYDELNRGRYIMALTDIVTSYQQGAVVAFNGAWGTGKTTFVRMWKQYLKNQGFPVVYYNAWEDDISEEPMFSMVKELKSLSKDEDSFDSLCEKAGRVIVSGFFGALKAAAGIWGDIAAGAIKEGADELKKDCLDSFKDSNSTSSLLRTFKEGLSDYLSSCKENTPLVFFVDELDRCNPTFAVKVLERIKHLFEVPNVVYILSLDKQQLCHSINGYFGSEKFNSLEYLKRFIDVDYTIPPMEKIDYCKCLIKKYGIDQVLDIQKTGGGFIDFIKILSEIHDNNCRQMERVFSLINLVLYSLKKKDDLNYSLLYFLCYLKVCEPELFDKVERTSLSIQELVNELEKIDSKVVEQRATLIKNENYLNVIGLFIILYRFKPLYYAGMIQEFKVQKNSDLIESKIFDFNTNLYDKQKLISLFYSIKMDEKTLKRGLTSYLSKISLLEKILDNDSSDEE